MTAEEAFRSGFVAIVGRPNVGKSTLVNQLVGRKVSIVSDRPQTTRTQIRGVRTTADHQIVFLDTPGLHKPRTLLGERANERAISTLSEVDVICMLVDATSAIGPGDRFVAGLVAQVSTPAVLVVNKVDAATPAQIAERLATATDAGGAFAETTAERPEGSGARSRPVFAETTAERPEGSGARSRPVFEETTAERPEGSGARSRPIFDAFVPVSARTGDGSDALTGELVARLPPGPQYYPDGVVSDQPESFLAAELLREKLLAIAREELPHSIAVTTDEIEERDTASGPLLAVRVVVRVERDSQKGMVIGRGGSVLKRAGTDARRELEALLGVRVHLETRVKVEPDWQRRAHALDRLGL